MDAQQAPLATEHQNKEHSVGETGSDVVMEDSPAYLPLGTAAAVPGIGTV